MKRIAILAVIFCSLLIPIKAYAARGVVVYYNFNSSKIVIQTGYNNYTCGTVYTGGVFIGEGDVIVGNLESYGYQDLYNLSDDEETSVYVDDYWASKDRVLRWINRGY